MIRILNYQKYSFFSKSIVSTVPNIEMMKLPVDIYSTGNEIVFINMKLNMVEYSVYDVTGKVQMQGKLNT